MDGGKAFWELGIGISGITFPDYVGSDERRTWPLPFPYVVYQSRRIKVDQGTVSGILPLTDRLSLDVSAGGALPVDSSHNKAREGMDDLDAVGEIGPSLKYDIYRSSDDQRRLETDCSPGNGLLGAHRDTEHPLRGRDILSMLIVH